MHAFYRKALLALIAVLLVDALIACFCVYRSYLSVGLMSSGHLRAVAITDAPQGGSSTVRMLDSARDSLRFGFRVGAALAYPWAGAGLLPEDARGRQAPLDLSRYGSITFLARCAPADSMIFDVSVFDEQVSKPGQQLTYPTPMTFFSCNERGVPVALDLTRLTIPQWWFAFLKLDLSHQAYKLDRVTRFEFAASQQSRQGRDAEVEISELTLHGRDYRYLAALAVLLLAGWAAFGVWFFRAYARALTACVDARLKKDLPFVAYRQLTLEPYRDKEKACILRYIASNYTNAELDLEAVVEGTGVNRNKINDVLKTELGMTFIGYLNKLRLTEAARLLMLDTGLAVSGIAYSVGYGNASYFNKLFKEEYGCTPKIFRGSATPAPLKQAAE